MHLPRRRNCLERTIKGEISGRERCATVYEGESSWSCEKDSLIYAGAGRCSSYRRQPPINSHGETSPKGSPKWRFYRSKVWLCLSLSLFRFLFLSRERTREAGYRTLVSRLSGAVKPRQEEVTPFCQGESSRGFELFPESLENSYPIAQKTEF